MEIELGKKEAYIDLKCFPHILMTGSVGVGKSYTISNIVAQICDTDRNTRVIYLSDDTKDFKKIEYLCDGSLINKTHTMDEQVFMSNISLLADVFKHRLETITHVELILLVILGAILFKKVS